MKKVTTSVGFMAVLMSAGVLLSTPAAAYWQFMERPPGAEVVPSPRFASKSACETALKRAETKLKMAYPDRYPLVGSCEEFK